MPSGVDWPGRHSGAPRSAERWRGDFPSDTLSIVAGACRGGRGDCVHDGDGRGVGARLGEAGVRVVVRSSPRRARGLHVVSLCAVHMVGALRVHGGVSATVPRRFAVHVRANYHVDRSRGHRFARSATLGASVLVMFMLALSAGIPLVAGSRWSRSWQLPWLNGWVCIAGARPRLGWIFFGGVLGARSASRTASRCPCSSRRSSSTSGSGRQRRSRRPRCARSKAHAMRIRAVSFLLLLGRGPTRKAARDPGKHPVGANACRG